MKKNYLFLMATAAMMAACSNETVMENPQEAISFNTSLRSVTRTGTGYTLDNLSKFKVHAVGTEGGFAENVSKLETGVWATETVHYWPETANLAFYAYAPATLTANIDATSQTLAYETPASIKDHSDIVVAYNTGSKASNAESGVNLNFRHQMAQIEVKATNEDTQRFTIEVLGVKLCNALSTSTLTFPTTAATDGSWGEATTKASYGSKFVNAITLTSEAQSIMANGDNIFVIPQTLTAWNPSTDATNTAKNAYISVLCKIKQNDGTAIYPKADSEGNQMFAYTAIPVGINLQMGHKYVFTLKFLGPNSGGGMTDPDPVNPEQPSDPSDPSQPGDPDINPTPGVEPGKPVVDSVINFNVTIEDWQDGGASDVTIQN